MNDRSVLEFVSVKQALTATKLHLIEAKKHLKLNHIFDVEYEITQAYIHLKMAKEIQNGTSVEHE